MQIFEENLAFIWPFIVFEDLSFLKLHMAKFCFFYFFGPGNPDQLLRTKSLSRCDITVWWRIAIRKKKLVSIFVLPASFSFRKSLTAKNSCFVTL
jgi:hypothetical protein